MTIEIQELVIRASIDETATDRSGVTKKAHARDDALIEKITRKVMQQVLERLEERAERL
ncbi:MAG: hypothetical protein K2Q15_02280 [Burkholderiales bacterium]|nr:hypothetical protein [Burkholderiales bacterium]